MRFDLNAKKTDAQWAEAIFTFSKNLTESAFKLMGYCAALAALKLAQRTTGSSALAIFNGALTTLLYVYVWAYFMFRFEFLVFSGDTAGGWRRWAHAAMNALVAFPLLYVTQHLTTQAVEALVVAASKK